MPKPPKTESPAQITISISICPNLLARIDACADDDKRSRSAFISFQLRKAIEKHNAKN